MCYSAKAVANAFIKVAKEEKLPLSNLVLQKLVFLAHGWYLGITKKPLTYGQKHGATVRFSPICIKHW